MNAAASDRSLRSVAFRKEREATWRELEQLIELTNKKRLTALSAEQLARLPHLYRAALSSLSVARSISLDRALTDYLESLPLPPNPYRALDGTLTPEGQRGKLLFEARAGCARCHAGPKAGGRNQAWIGTTREGMALDVPHLAGVYDTDPYLHDGRAKTLEEIFQRHNAQQLHGKVQELSPGEMKDLLEYVREL